MLSILSVVKQWKNCYSNRAISISLRFFRDFMICIFFNSFPHASDVIFFFRAIVESSTFTPSPATPTEKCIRTFYYEKKKNIQKDVFALWKWFFVGKHGVVRPSDAFVYGWREAMRLDSRFSIDNIEYFFQLSFARLFFQFRFCFSFGCIWTPSISIVDKWRTDCKATH